MAASPNGADALGRVRDALFEAVRKAKRLAESVERLEEQYKQVSNPNPARFYVPTELDDTWGRNLDSEWTDSAPQCEHPPRRAAIDATLKLRDAVDFAIEAVCKAAAYMDGEAQSVDQRWTVRTIGHLRKLRGAIVRGHGCDLCPSALPMIRAGVPDALREHAQHVAERMEEVKSAILAGVQQRTPTVSVFPELLQRVEAGIAAAGSLSKAHDERITRVEQAVRSVGRAEPKALPGSVRYEIVLWEGAEHNERNVRLARTRTAYLEAHGNVTDALAALKAAGNEISRSTFYNHLNALDTAIPRWREFGQLSNPVGILDGLRKVGTRRKSRG